MDGSCLLMVATRVSAALPGAVVGSKRRGDRVTVAPSHDIDPQWVGRTVGRSVTYRVNRSPRVDKGWGEAVKRPISRTSLGSFRQSRPRTHSVSPRKNVTIIKEEPAIAVPVSRCMVQRFHSCG
ncbi:hypothetical protein BJX61DRAFT_77147 [Aspergillus egyptiacus]|nr:hypothetical protein BJX61DRAFT_77147 [Aspergillus egyptiacus]